MPALSRTGRRTGSWSSSASQNTHAHAAWRSGSPACERNSHAYIGVHHLLVDGGFRDRVRLVEAGAAGLGRMPARQLRELADPRVREEPAGSLSRAERIASASAADRAALSRLQGQPSGVSEPYGCEQGGPANHVHFLPLSLAETDLGQHTTRGGVPVPDGGPQTFVPGRSRPVQNR
jgi:hypothetical protein